MLIVLGGLPATGKTTIARELARLIGAVHVRIDSIEQAISESRIAPTSIEDAGYRVGYAVAEDNLRLGLHGHCGLGQPLAADARGVAAGRESRPGRGRRSGSRVLRSG